MKDLKLTEDEVEFLVEFLDTSLFMEIELLEVDKESDSSKDVADQEERVELFKSILDKLK